MSAAPRPLSVLAAFFVAASATAQEGAGTEGALLLQLTPAPRPVALGGAFVALADGPLALHHGPAGLAGAPRGVVVAYQTLPTDASAGLGAVALPLGPGTLGAGLSFVDYGEVPEILPGGSGLVGQPTGAVVRGGELAVAVGYGVRLGRVRLGAVARSLQIGIAELGTRATAYDLGAGIEVLDDRVALRVAVQNLGPDVEAGRPAPLPTVLRAGASFRVSRGPGRHGILAVEAHAPRAALDGPRPVQAAVGAEWTFRVAGASVSARLGYRQKTAAGDAFNGLAAGGGVRFGRLSIDYAYRPLGPLGATQHLGLTYLPDG